MENKVGHLNTPEKELTEPTPTVESQEPAGNAQAMNLGSAIEELIQRLRESRPLNKSE